MRLEHLEADADELNAIVARRGVVDLPLRISNLPFIEHDDSENTMGFYTAGVREGAMDAAEMTRFAKQVCHDKERAVIRKCTLS